MGRSRELFIEQREYEEFYQTIKTMEKGKIEKIQKVIDQNQDQKKWVNKEGKTFFIWALTINGQTGEVFSLTSNLSELPYAEGDEVTYTANDTEYGLKFKGVKKPGENYQAKKYSKTDEDFRTFSVSYAKDLVVADKVELKDLLSLSNKIYEFIKSGEVPKAKTEKVEKQIEEIENNELYDKLPF